MKKMFSLLLLGSFLALAWAAGAQNPDPLTGKWWNEEKDAQIEIYACDGKFCGKIIWLKEPNYPDNNPSGMGGKPKVDRENPDPSKRERPLLGMNLIWGFTPSSATLWEAGFIYNPRDGKTYKCKLTLERPDRLIVRGFIGFSLIGKTNIWTRVK
jgi:uncharacterized protein (DUF2147 family)